MEDEEEVKDAFDEATLLLLLFVVALLVGGGALRLGRNRKVVHVVKEREGRARTTRATAESSTKSKVGQHCSATRVVVVGPSLRRMRVTTT